MTKRVLGGENKETIRKRLGLVQIENSRVIKELPKPLVNADATISGDLLVNDGETVCFHRRKHSSFAGQSLREFVTPVRLPQWDFQKPWASRLAIVKGNCGPGRRKTLAGIPFPATKVESLQVHRRTTG